MKKRGDWVSRLHSFVDETARAPIDVGKHDCALFWAGAVEAMTGEDLAAPFLGYETYKEGLKRLHAAGYQNHVELAAAHFEEIPPVQAALGDLVVFEVDGGTGLACGICSGEHSVVLREDGRGMYPTLSAVRAFRIP